MENAASVEGEKLETIKGDLNRLNGQVERCVEISRRYLSFLHGQTVERSQVGVNQVLKDLQDLLIRHPSAKGHQLVVRGLDQDVIAEVNGTDFLQILLNITINALQNTTRPQRVEVVCALHPEPIEIQDFPDGPEQRVINREGFENRTPILAISVEDNGTGISPDALRKMCEERFTTKPSHLGTGLGLSIVKRLVKEARGALLIQTRLGEFSRFTLYFQTLPAGTPA